MTRLVVIDGVIQTPEHAVISVYDRGFLYGDSVFETVRTYSGKLYALDQHLQRLERSAQSIGVTLPVPWEQIGVEAKRAIVEADNDESYVRIMVTRGSGPLGLDTELATSPLRVILVEPLRSPPEAHYLEGIGAICVQTVRASDAVHSAKLGNYLASALALRDAKKAGAEEALVVNRNGLVIEGTTSNVFMIKGEALVTPPLHIGILEGVTRGVVMDLAEREGLRLVEEALSVADLKGCAEVFITSSIREILAVVRVDGEAIGEGKPGPVTRRLLEVFRAHVRR
jgi:branched-chain amino acid aminotransferase